MKKQHLFIASLVIFSSLFLLSMNSCMTNSKGGESSKAPYLGVYTVDSMQIKIDGKYQGGGSYTGTFELKDLSDIGGVKIKINGVEVNANTTLTLSKGDIMIDGLPQSISAPLSTQPAEVTATSIKTAKFSAAVTKISDTRISIADINAKDFFNNSSFPDNYEITLFLTKK